MSEDEVKFLNIRKLQRNDTGDYLCRVLNEYGYNDLIHHLIVLPGKKSDFIVFLKKGNICFFFKASERPSLLKMFLPSRGRLISNKLPDALIITIACIIGILLLGFIFFLIYHFRNQKSLRQTLLATRILATRGISNLKSVS